MHCLLPFASLPSGRVTNPEEAAAPIPTQSGTHHTRVHFAAVLNTDDCDKAWWTSGEELWWRSNITDTTNHEPNTPSSILFSLLFFLICLKVAWCSNYSEEGNARHTTRRKEEMNVQEGCFSCQVGSSNQWKSDGEQGGGVLGLEDVTNFL
jgi:hypothetical protein